MDEDRAETPQYSVDEIMDESSPVEPAPQSVAAEPAVPAVPAETRRVRKRRRVKKQKHVKEGKYMRMWLFIAL